MTSGAFHTVKDRATNSLTSASSERSESVDVCAENTLGFDRERGIVLPHFSSRGMTTDGKRLMVFCNARSKARISNDHRG